MYKQKSYCEERSNVYIKPKVREPSGDDLVASIMSVLPDLSHQYSRPSSLCLFKRLHHIVRSTVEPILVLPTTTVIHMDYS